MELIARIIGIGSAVFKMVSSFLNAKQRNEDREAGRNEQRVKDLEAQNRAKDAMLGAAVDGPTPDDVVDRLRNNKF